MNTKKTIEAGAKAIDYKSLRFIPETPATPVPERFTCGQYFFWFLLVPLILTVILTGITGEKKFADEEPWLQIVTMIIGVPMLVNLFIGPSIYAFWKHKKSRVIILVLNVMFVMAGGLPGLLMWLWAWFGAAD
jgi:hypothetical protein